MGTDGNIWFADYTANVIGIINPKTDNITEFPVPTPDAGLQDITTGPDGKIWFTETVANQVGMINSTTHAITEFPVPTANSWLEDITAGPDGNLWFTEQVGNAIGMINPTTDAITEYPIPAAYAMPSAIAAGPDGNLWFGYFNGDDVGMINPTTDTITQYVVPLAQPNLVGLGGPAGITVGPDGNIWITLNNADELGVFDPQTVTAEPTGPSLLVIPGFPQPPTVVSPPIVSAPTVSAPIVVAPTTPANTQATAPATPVMPFGFTVTLSESLGQGDTASSGAVTLALVINAGNATITLTTQDGVDTFSGLTLKKLGNRSAYKIVSTHSGGNTVMTNGRAAALSTRPIPIATEEILGAGRGKDTHVVADMPFHGDPVIRCERGFTQQVARPCVPSAATSSRSATATATPRDRTGTVSARSG